MRKLAPKNVGHETILGNSIGFCSLVLQPSSGEYQNKLETNHSYSMKDFKNFGNYVITDATEMWLN